MLAATDTDQQRNQSKSTEKTGSISLEMALMPGKNGDLGVECLPVVLDLAFRAGDKMGAEAGMQVSRHQLSIGAFSCDEKMRGEWSP